ncbi:MAG: ABC transporter ATP-binding protein [Caldimicrobium sp.]
MIKLKGIKKSFYNGGKKVEILKGIDLEIKKGEKIAIVGPSGSGKTTLLNIIGTLDMPDEGTIIWEDRPINFQKEEELANLRKNKIGFVFQFYHLLPELTVLENIILPGLIAGWSRKRALEKGEELLKRLNLWEKHSSKIYVLSGGERQKVAIGRAIFLNPLLLLADEPTGNLDPESGREVINLFLELNAAYALTLIMVTHNLFLAKNMDKVYLLKEGFIVEYNNFKVEA